MPGLKKHTQLFNKTNIGYRFYPIKWVQKFQDTFPENKTKTVSHKLRSNTVFYTTWL